jgi:hypothetical protein
MSIACREEWREDVSVITTTEVSTYSANLISPGDPNELAATVWLFRADSSLLAFLGFYRDGVQMRANEFRTDLNAAIASYSFDAYAPIVDLLRNEKPVYLTWFDYSDAVPGRIFAELGTSREPIGEGEGVAI